MWTIAGSLRLAFLAVSVATTQPATRPSYIVGILMRVTQQDLDIRVTTTGMVQTFHREAPGQGVGRQEESVGEGKTGSPTLRPGQTIEAIVVGQRVLAAREVSQPPVIGVITRIDGERMSVEVVLNKSTRSKQMCEFVLDRVRSMVQQRPADGARPRPTTLADLEVGEVVAVTADNELAKEIRIEPPKPIFGHIVQIGDEAIKIKCDPSGNKGAHQEEQFTCDVHHIALMVARFGLPMEENGTSNDLQMNQRVAVYRRGAQTAVVLLADSVRATVVSSDHGLLVVMTDTGVKQVYSCNRKETRIYLGRIVGSVSSRNGKSIPIIQYNPNGTSGDLILGRDVIISAKGGEALAVFLPPGGLRRGGEDRSVQRTP
jgi:hypothetical protein